MTALGRHADPLQLAGQGFLALGLGLFLTGQTFLLLLQPGGIIALPGDAPAPVQFQNPARHVVQKIAVVGHGDDRAREGGQIALQPGHGLGVQVVGGFVQEQNVGILEQQAAKGHAAAFAAGNLLHRHVARRAAQGVHGHFQAGFQIPDALGVHLLLHFGLPGDEGVHLLRLHGLGEFGVDFLKLPGDGRKVADALLHHFAHSARFTGQGLLLQITDGIAGGQHGFAVKGLVHTGQNFQQAGLARAVEAQHADLGPVKIGKRNVFQHFLLAVALGHADHGINNLVRFVAHRLLRVWDHGARAGIAYGASVWPGCKES